MPEDWTLFSASERVAVLSLASVLRDTAKYPICDNGNYHYRNLCRRGREKGGSGVPVYAFGGGTFLWFLPARRIVQRRSTGRGHADDSKDTGLRLDDLDGETALQRRNNNQAYIERRR